MREFKIGDRVRVIGTADSDATDGTHRTGDTGSVVKYDFTFNGGVNFDYGVVIHGRVGRYDADELELVTTKEQKPMARRTFRLLKETPTLRKGAIYQEACDDGTQPYVLLDTSFHKGDEKTEISNRTLVEDQPQWFVEVFKVTPEYMTKDELAAFEAFKKATKPVAKKRNAVKKVK